MRHLSYVSGIAAFSIICVLATTAGAEWIEFVDASATALDADAALVAEDEQEKTTPGETTRVFSHRPTTAT